MSKTRIIVSTPDKHQDKICPSCGKELEMLPDPKTGFAWPHLALAWHCRYCRITGAAIYKVSKGKFVEHTEIMRANLKPARQSSQFEAVRSEQW